MTFKKILFQVHWFIGITAGVVMAIVGVTGSLLSFEHELLHLFNPGVMHITSPGTQSLPPVELIQRVQTANPGRRIVSLTVSSDPEDTARVGFAVDAQSAPAAPGGQRRGEMRYVDPYSGAVLEKPAGEEFFRTVTRIHRWLAAGETGKQIVGAATIGLIVLCCSGLYLRWPKRITDWRAWFVFRLALKGRGFLWELHAVIGTWTLLFYLLAGLTGLYWSYDWYRDALFAITGAPRPAQAGAGGGQQSAPPGAPISGAQAKDEAGQGARVAQPNRQQTDIGNIWEAFRGAVPEFSTATLRLPEKSGQAVQITYLDRDPPHERATNRVTLDATDGKILQHERYAEKTAGAKIMSSMFALHSGSFFGKAGTILMMLASLAMPLFAITGWMMYLDRRAKKSGKRRSRAPVPGAKGSAGRARGEKA